MWFPRDELSGKIYGLGLVWCQTDSIGNIGRLTPNVAVRRRNALPSVFAGRGASVNAIVCIQRSGWCKAGYSERRDDGTVVRGIRRNNNVGVRFFLSDNLRSNQFYALAPEVNKINSVVVIFRIIGLRER